MNNHYIDGSSQYNIGFIDSGTTFSYFPHGLWNAFKIHFEWFCNLDTDNHCKGKIVHVFENKQEEEKICFEYDVSQNAEGPFEYFHSYPLLNFRMKKTDRQDDYINF